MIKSILRVLLTVCLIFGLVISIPIACRSCNVSADTINLTANYENVGNVNNMSNPSIDGYSYTQIMSVAPIRNHLTGGGIQSSFENLCLGFMGNTLSSTGDTILTDNNYIDVFTTVIDNEESANTRNTLILQRRTIMLSVQNGNKYYTASDDLLSNWYVSLKSTFGGAVNNVETNYKINYFSLQLGSNDLSAFNDLSVVKCFLFLDGSGYVENVYRFYKDGDVSIGSLYITLDYIYGGSNFKANEIWLDPCFSININNVLNRYYQDIYDSGFNYGRELGYRQGYNDGYNDGEDYGYQVGLEDGANSDNTTPVFTAIVRGMSRIFAVELLPNFYIGHLMFLGLGLTVFGFLIHLFLR